MGDSDDDYRDVGFENNALYVMDGNDATEHLARTSKVNSLGKKVRGKDIEWIEVARYSTILEYKESLVYKEIKEKFSCMRKRSPEYADTEHFVCKYARKVGYVPCHVQYMVIFYSHNDEVGVSCDGGNEEHHHELNAERAGDGGNFRWTVEQTSMIIQGVQNEARPAVIRRNLENANLFHDGKVPSAQQLNNKIAHIRISLNKSQQIFTTHDLREKIKEHLDIPEDDNTAYIAAHEVIDDDETKEPRFTVIWTSRRMLARTSNNMTQDDATYRLTWQGK